MSLDDVKAGKAASDLEPDEPKRGRGRPPGAKNKTKGGAATVPPPPEMDPAVVDVILDTSLQQLAAFPVAYFQLEPDLTPEERAAVAGAAKPVLLKYLGDLMFQFGPEAALLLTVYMVYGRRSKRERAKNPDSGNTGIRENVPGKETTPILDPFTHPGPS